MDDNKKDYAEPPNQHTSVLAELNELEALVLLMLSSNISPLPQESRQHLLELAYRLISTALDKAHGQTPA